MRNNKIISFFIILAMTCLPLLNSNAAITARPLGKEKRIKIINYTPNTVFQYVGHYMYQSILEFGLDEEIETVLMGTPTPWKIIPSGNRMFIKPIDDNATTNMTVVTNKRMYFFEMHAEEAKGIDDENLSFVVKFVYPDDSNFNSIKQVHQTTAPKLSNPELYNFRYKLSGKAKHIEPVEVFDDGKFTYFKFREESAEIPAIFMVFSDNTEGLVNYRVADGYVVVERTAPKFTLRSGNDTMCVFNENWKR